MASTLFSAVSIFVLEHPTEDFMVGYPPLMNFSACSLDPETGTFPGLPTYSDQNAGRQGRRVDQY